MYYPQQSPGITHKLATHHEHSAWGRATTAAASNHSHSILVPGSQSVGVPPLQSPGYPLYTNGALQQHHPGHHPLSHAPMHHHQNSLSHYPSPPNGHAHQQQQQQQQHLLAQGSPAGQIISPHWQQQLLKCDMIRQSRSPHHRARANAMASRTIPKSAIPITNPNNKSIAITSPRPESANGRMTKSSPDSSTAAASNSASDPASNSPNTNHPSSTVAPVAEAPRLMATKPPENTWGSLDMGGVNIKNLPGTNGLFSFTFLINLYLNHNALTSVPPEIAKLKHLELLDLSGNALTTLPPELGLLTQLKELYLFDNHLSTLPPELGYLHQLQTLGIEGNPMDANLKSIIQKDGTSALVCYLRDSYTTPPAPPPRQWKNLLSGPERDSLTADPHAETFSLLCFNILCERYATERLYGYTPSWALLWNYRRDMIIKEILSHDTDLVCLQEVSIAQYEDFFSKTLGEHGYSGAYHPKGRAKTMNETDRRTVDGCATFFKNDRFQLVESQLVDFSALAMQRQDFKKTDDMFNRVLGKDHIAVVASLEDVHTGTRLIVANAHIHWDPAYSDVKLVQTALLVEEVEKCANNFAKYPPRPPAPATPGDDSEQSIPQRPPPIYTDGTKIPVILCGDYNSGPGSGVCDFMATGYLPPSHPDFLSHTYGRYASEGLKHRLNLKSAYAAPGAGGEHHVTNFTPGFKGEIDYVWYTAGNLGINAVLEKLDQRYLEKCVGFPNMHFPSDHVAIAAEFRVKPPRDQPTKSPSTFSNT